MTGAEILSDEVYHRSIEKSSKQNWKSRFAQVFRVKRWEKPRVDIERVMGVAPAAFYGARLIHFIGSEVISFWS